MQHVVVFFTQSKPNLKSLGLLKLVCKIEFEKSYLSIKYKN